MRNVVGLKGGLLPSFIDEGSLTFDDVVHMYYKSAFIFMMICNHIYDFLQF